MFSKNIRVFLRTLFWLIAFSTLSLLIGRFLFLTQITESDQLLGRGVDLARTFWMGTRFDLKVISIGFAPLFLAALGCAAFDRAFHWVKKITPYYAGVILFLLVGMALANFYYYVTYGNHIDLFVFGLFDDDTSAVLTNAWEDYPIIRCVLVSMLWGYLGYRCAKKTLNRAPTQTRPYRTWLTTVVVVVSLLGYITLARGSWGTFPLNRYAAMVSDYKPFNIVTPNAFMALDWAKTDYKKQFKFAPVDPATVTQHFERVLGQPTPEFHTAKNSYLETHKPHVVMALMEGMGTNVLIEDKMPNNDLLGALRPHFESDFVFTKFMAGTSATIDSLMAMLVHSNVPTISHSSMQKVALPSAAVLPYKRAGYHTVFITAGNGMWRNIANYLPYQGFDQVLDENTIYQNFPEARELKDTWGAPDAYAFALAEKILSEATQPTFIYVLTVTNHSPYRAPKNYHAKPVQVSARLNERLGALSDEGTNLLQAYQYANNALGQFISDIKASDLGQRTIIAASGDHRVRYLNIEAKDEFALSMMVPFYLYVPQQILAQVPFKYDATRIGSHRDIFPTLYAMSLSDADYMSLGGKNMLTPAHYEQMGYNNIRSMDARGAYNSQNAKTLYPWQQSHGALPDYVQAIESQMQTIPYQGNNPAEDYRLMQDYYLRLQLQQANALKK
ncbi:LTA synthase family protein [Vibrio stylophorae]|nr:alkaline phosphatase family protein [Vibrio stylophorae]